ncbi:CocE/NonD family hydrolase [Pseudonocardia charpentierae]|uniref:CocE/NonD family hydrolase n=1 Tax=Pseudonocardia charpentierae TaxID=3075545 RepID=A0ABU2NIJ2_9PSEU|nr:CocE/NonD family hydrolase [Pseudonocardia sp. DSM 45834]MDT0353790.1 CocE/NonD family hydrolase [Pseudonocardia sp. DSM 45834]
MTDAALRDADTEVRDGMRISWDVPVSMSDGTVLRADIFHPVDEGRYPVIMSYGCYAKGLSFQTAYKAQWDRMVQDFPEITEGTTNKYQCWEVADPERWVPDGYVVIRIDSRGAGRSQGVQNVWSMQEIWDYYECIEWAGEQPWSNGNVGLLGISYYGANQWLVASLQPPQLKAIIPWEGTSDWYREVFRHGGIRNGFLDLWLPKQLAMQHGYGERGARNPITGELVAGPETLTDDELEKNRVDKVAEVRAHPLLDDYYQGLAPDWSKVTVPVLSAANWGGQGLHLRGNIEGFTQAASESKWLEVHGLEHWTHFYTPYGVGLQKRFFDHFLRELDNGWDQQPKVTLQVRQIKPGDHGSIAGEFVERGEDAWPLDRTQWTRYHLHGHDHTMTLEKAGAPAQAEYDAAGPGVTFSSGIFDETMEITGPLAAKLFISSTTDDADLFLVLRVLDPIGREVVFRGAMDAHTPVAQGWLRASHRRVDPKRSTPYRPYHLHTVREPLEPNEVYEVDVEIWPTSVVVPAGYRIALTVRGKDYEYDGPTDGGDNAAHRYPSRGVGPFVHNDPIDRPTEVFGGAVRVHTGGEHESYLLLPVIPSQAR